ncbi:MAG: 6-pyruvoyl tetrahydropterin synthase family protein [Acidobacteriota bacterium]
MILNKIFRFEAAHRLPYHQGICRREHGHSYRLRVSVEVDVDPATGMGCDFAELDSAVAGNVIARADHQNLNDFLENPTAENICLWAWELLAGTVPGRLVEIELHETGDSSCVYRGPDPMVN